MDSIDQEILQILQNDNRLTAAEVGARIGLSVSAANERIRRLNASGVITANRSIIDPACLGLDLCAFLFIDLEARSDEAAFAAAVAAIAEIMEAHHITGSHSWLLKIRVRDTAALQHLIAKKLKAMPGVVRSETIIVLHTAKETSALPLASPARDEVAGLSGQEDVDERITAPTAL